MSYRDDLNVFAEEMAKRKKNTWTVLKITVVLVAVCFIVAAVFLVLDLAADSQKQPPVGQDLPSIRLKEGSAIYMYAGETVSFRDKVTYTEGCRINVNQDNLNKDVQGTYTVTYVATSPEGTSSYLDVTVYVTKKDYTYATLMSMIDEKAEALGIKDSMSKREKIEKVYEFVNGDIAFNNETANGKSNTPDIDRNNWQTDWIEEAIRTLNLELDGKTVKGDCYSYYSVSKAFFEYFGIEHVGIQRDNSKIDPKYGTHFWFVVNIGSLGTGAQWYYYDATRLKYTFSDDTHNACLITLEKLNSYHKLNGDKQGYNFYDFNPSQYPTASKVTLK